MSEVLTPEDVRELAPLYDAVIFGHQTGLRPRNSGKRLRPRPYLRTQYQQGSRGFYKNDLLPLIVLWQIIYWQR